MVTMPTFGVRRLPWGLQVAHTGWRPVRQVMDHPVFDEIPDNTCFYFDHSYHVDPIHAEDITTTSDYGIDYASIVGRDRVFGVQFHPEKSQHFGLKILENFGNME